MKEAPIQDNPLSKKAAPSHGVSKTSKPENRIAKPGEKHFISKTKAPKVIDGRRLAAFRRITGVHFEKPIAVVQDDKEVYSDTDDEDDNRRKVAKNHKAVENQNENPSLKPSPKQKEKQDEKEKERTANTVYPSPTPSMEKTSSPRPDTATGKKANSPSSNTAEKKRQTEKGKKQKPKPKLPEQIELDDKRILVKGMPYIYWASFFYGYKVKPDLPKGSQFNAQMKNYYVVASNLREVWRVLDDLDGKEFMRYKAKLVWASDVPEKEGEVETGSEKSDGENIDNGKDDQTTLAQGDDVVDSVVRKKGGKGDKSAKSVQQRKESLQERRAPIVKKFGNQRMEKRGTRATNVVTRSEKWKKIMKKYEHIC